MSEPEDKESEATTREGVDAAAHETVSVYTDMSASSEQTAKIEPGESPPPISQRRLVPPDRQPRNWRQTHRRLLAICEWVVIAIFFAVSLYYLYLLIFTPRHVAWKVEAQSGRWRYIVLHHSATVGGTPEAFDRYHRQERGWENGLGYHFVIGNGQGMGDGEIAVGRRWLEQLDGAHVNMAEENRANSFCIGVALVGDFQKSPPTAAQLASLDGLLAFLVDEYGIETDKIVGHGQVSKNHTDCPGRLFPLPEVVKILAARSGTETRHAGSGG